MDLIKEPMYIEGKACWLNHLENALQKYNNRVHGPTKMTPFEMSTNQKLIPNQKFIKNSVTKIIINYLNSSQRFRESS